MKEISITLKDKTLKGFLTLPEKAKGLVIFVHGSGSGRHSVRNQFVAKELNKFRFATLLLDLLTEKEEQIDEITAQIRFDIPLLADRVKQVIEWAKKNAETKQFSIALFGASTGAAAALIAAADRKEVRAIVSRGGRADLAADALAQVKAPTLLIVGGEDTEVIKLNEQAFHLLGCTKKLEIVKGATHLFEEEGKLEEVAKLAAEWFKNYF